MKIAGFELYRVPLPIVGKPYSMSSGTLNSVETVLLRLTLEGGQIGWGETCPLGTTYAPAHASGAVAALCEILPGLIGTQAAPRPVHARMDALLAGHAYAKAAVDIAVHDAVARQFGVPVSTMLGGALRTELPAYYAIGIETPEDTARIGREKVAQGFRRLQLKVGGRAPHADIAAVRALWDVVKADHVRLAIDANRGWSVRDAIEISQACRDIPMVIEQPCKTLAEHRQLKLQLSHPLFLDESIRDLDTTLEMVGTGLADGFGMKVTRLGGLAPSTAFRDICAVRNLPHTCNDSWGGDIIAAACLHLGATVGPDLLEGVWIAADYIADTGPYGATIRAENGRLSVPDGPGLGVAPNAEALGPAVEVFQ